MLSDPRILSTEQLVDLYTAVSSRLRKFDGEADAASAMTAIAVQMLPGSDFAGLTRLRAGGALVTLGATDPLVEQVDRVQYELGSGPCVDGLVSDRPVIAEDLRESRQWPEFGRHAAELGVRSMLSYRLHLEGGQNQDQAVVLGGMNFYSRRPGAFEADRVFSLVTVLASFCALAVWGGSLAERAKNVESALASSRDIGAAQGILMERYKLPRDEAFGLLAVVSQQTNRKLRDIAVHLVETGEVPLPPPHRGRR